MLRLTPLAAELVRGSPFDLGPYIASLAERPGCLELLEREVASRLLGWSSAQLL